MPTRIRRGLGGMAAAATVALVAASSAWAAPTITNPTAGLRTSDNTPALNGTADTGGSASSTVTVRIYAGSTVSGSPVQTLNLTRSGAAWSDTAAALADGTYTVQAVQVHGVGKSTSGTTFVVDTTAPPVTVAAPVEGARTADSTPTLSGTAGSATGDSATVTVSVFAGTGTSGTPVQTLPVARSDASWSDTASALPDGTYTVQATQADDLGNSASTAGTTFVVDTSGPDLTIDSPADGGATNDTTPPANGAAGDGAGDSATIALKVYAGSTATGTPLQSVTVTRSGAAWATGLATLAPGTYTLEAAQGDDLGHTAIVTSTFDVDTTPPTVTITAPAEGSSSNQTTPTLTGSATGTRDVTVRIFTGATLVRTLTAPNGPSGWSVAASPALTPGSYYAVASQTDLAGNTGSSANRSFTVTQPPSTSGTGPITPVTSQNTPPARTNPVVAAPSLLAPFPIVRIVGRLTRTGAKLSLLSVRAPARATVDVRCQGKSCPFKRRVLGVGTKGRTVKVAQLAGRTLRAGVIIEVRVRDDDRVGKYTRFRIRKGKSPLRVDSCVMPGEADPVRCPS